MSSLKETRITHTVHGIDGVPHHAASLAKSIQFAQEKKGYDSSGFGVMPEFLLDSGNQAEQELTGPFASSAIEPEEIEHTVGVSLHWMQAEHEKMMRSKEKKRHEVIFWDPLSKESGRNVIDPGKQDASISPYIRSLMRFHWQKRQPKQSLLYGLTTSRQYLMINGTPKEGQIPMSELKKGEEMADVYGDFLYNTYLQSRSLFEEGSAEQQQVDARWRQAYSSLDVALTRVKACYGDAWTFTQMRNAFGMEMARRFQSYDPSERDRVRDSSIIEYVQDHKLVGLIMGDQTGAYAEWDGALKNMTVQSTFTGEYDIPEAVDTYDAFVLTSEKSDLSRFRHVDAILQYPDAHRRAYNEALDEKNAPQKRLAETETPILINTEKGRFRVHLSYDESKKEWKMGIIQKDEKRDPERWVSLGNKADIQVFSDALQDSTVKDLVGDRPVVSLLAVAFLPSLVYFHDEGISGVGIQHRGSSYKPICKEYAKKQREYVKDPAYQLPDIHVPGPKYDFWKALAQERGASSLRLSDAWKNFYGTHTQTAQEFFLSRNDGKEKAHQMVQDLTDIAENERQQIGKEAGRIGASREMVSQIEKYISHSGDIRPDRGSLSRLTENGEVQLSEEDFRIAQISLVSTMIQSMRKQFEYVEGTSHFASYSDMRHALSDDVSLSDIFLQQVNLYRDAWYSKLDFERQLGEINNKQKDILHTVSPQDATLLLQAVRSPAYAEYGIDTHALSCVSDCKEQQEKSSDADQEDGVITQMLIHIEQHISDHMKMQFYEEHLPSYVDAYRRYQAASDFLNQDHISQTLDTVVREISQRDGNGVNRITLRKDFSDLVAIELALEKEIKGSGNLRKIQGLQSQKHIAESRISQDVSQVGWDESSWRMYYDEYKTHTSLSHTLAQAESDSKHKPILEEYEKKGRAAYAGIKETFAREREAYARKDAWYAQQTMRLKDSAARSRVLVQALGKSSGPDARGLRMQCKQMEKELDEFLSNDTFSQELYKDAVILAHMSADLHEIASSDWGATRASAFTAWLVGGERFLWRLANDAVWQYDNVY